MSPTIPVRTVHMEYKGVFDIQEMWLVVIDWMNSKMCEVVERKVKHKVKTFGEEIEMEVEAWRNVNTFFRYWFKVFVKIYDANEVEVVKDGVKKMLKKCRILIIVSADMEYDYSGRFSNSRFQEKLRDFLIKYVLYHNANAFWADQLDYKAQELADVIKDYLNMETKGSAHADSW